MNKSHPKSHPSEVEEWMGGRIDSWVETYKKSMLTPIVLRLVASHQPIGIAALADQLAETTGWRVTERGLYRTVKRLQDSGFIVHTEVDAPRTGAKRKELSLSGLGEQFLAGIEANIVDFPK